MAGRGEAQHEGTVGRPGAAESDAGQGRYHPEECLGEVQVRDRGGGGHHHGPDQEHPVEGRLRADLVREPAPQEAAGDGAENPGQENDLNLGVGEADLLGGVDAHRRDHSVGGVGEEDPPDQEAAQVWVVPGADHGVPQLPKGAPDRGPVQRAGAGARPLPHPEEAGEGEEQEEQGGELEDQRAPVGVDGEHGQAKDHADQRATVADADAQATDASPVRLRADRGKEGVVEDQAGLKEVVGDDEEDQGEGQATHAE